MFCKNAPVCGQKKLKLIFLKSCYSRYIVGSGSKFVSFLLDPDFATLLMRKIHFLKMSFYEYFSVPEVVANIAFN